MREVDEMRENRNKRVRSVVRSSKSPGGIDSMLLEERYDYERCGRDVRE